MKTRGETLIDRCLTAEIFAFLSYEGEMFFTLAVGLSEKTDSPVSLESFPTWRNICSFTRTFLSPEQHHLKGGGHTAAVGAASRAGRVKVSVISVLLNFRTTGLLSIAR